MADSWNTDGAATGKGNAWHSGDAPATNREHVNGQAENGDGEHAASGINGVPDEGVDYKLSLIHI